MIHRYVLYVNRFKSLKIFVLSFLVIPLSSELCSCVRSSAKIGGYFYTDTLYSDSFGCNGHSFIRFRVPHSNEFQVIHNPDCFCRFNRTFIVVKKSK